MKTLLCILGTMYVLAGLNAIRKGNKVRAAYQLFWALTVAGVLLFSGCATRSYVRDEIDWKAVRMNHRCDSRRTDVVKHIGDVERKVDDLEETIMKSSDVRLHMNREVWTTQLDEFQYNLDLLRKKLGTEQ